MSSYSSAVVRRNPTPKPYPKPEQGLKEFLGFNHSFWTPAVS